MYNLELRLALSLKDRRDSHAKGMHCEELAKKNLKPSASQ